MDSHGLGPRARRRQRSRRGWSWATRPHPRRRPDRRQLASPEPPPESPGAAPALPGRFSSAPAPTQLYATCEAGVPGGQFLALGLLLIDHPRVQDERPVIVLTPTGYQAKCFISLDDSSRLLAHAEQLVKDLKFYRSRATEWGEQMDFFVGNELPEDLRRLGFVDPK